MGGKDRKTHVFGPDPGAAGNSPLAILASLKGSLPTGGEPEPEPPAPPANPKQGGKIVVCRERKGRGGKTATLVEGVALTGAALEAFGREMRQSLGTGGGIEGNAIVISGDQVERAMNWLRARGATRLVAGN